MSGYDDLLDDDVVPDAKPVKAEPKKRGRPKRPREITAPHAEPRSSKCQMYAPRGTTCKYCGKVHPI